MSGKTRIKAGIILFLLSMNVVINSFGQEVPPLVYDVEFTGADCTKPPLPTKEELPIIEPLTDPFEWSDGSGRDTTFASWAHRRAEIKAELENYEIGPKPDRPDTITASYANDTLTVNVTVNGNTLTLTSVITLPEGEGPFPAVIGIGSGTGSLPRDIFTSRKIALIPFNFGQVMAWQQVRGTEPINKLYPDLTYMGAYSAWPWGVSRLIDGLELVSDDLPIDLKHLAITGCSFAGKMALFAGAFDERIALTIPQESGGGGAAAWRVSETLGAVEKLGSTNFVWFLSSMSQFSNKNVSKLPLDHHELMAMVAPRALLNIGNPSQVWLAEESGYTSSEAAKLVWDNFGISDRMGFTFNKDHGHCALPPIQVPEVEAFVDKFLLGDTTVNTNITTQDSYDNVIPSYWTDWWGTGDPIFAVLDRGESEEVWIEAECATVGAAWNVRLDTLASNEGYAEPKPGLNSTKEAPSDSETIISFPFTVTSDTSFYLYGLVNCPTTHDSYWVKMDDEPFVGVYSLGTIGWQWKEFTKFELTAGDHTLNIAYREEGAKLDKICISTFHYPPGKWGETADFICVPDTTTQAYNPVNGLNAFGESEYSLGQNYPNPLNNNTTIAFEIPRSTFVSLKVYSVLGEEIAELAGKDYNAGSHIVEFDARNLSRGIYFYMFKADKFSTSRKMIIQPE